MDITITDTPPLGGWGSKHEIISCERCGSRFECKANSYTKCHCTTVELTINETQYISEQYDSCLCASCLQELQAEYQNLESGL